MNPKPKEESTSPEKKSKAKLPDFEKTLTNWVRNQQKKGLPVTDEELRKQAQMFSFSRDDQAEVSSASWLEKFKLKNYLLAHSNDNDTYLVNSGATSHSQTPVEESPTSSSDLVSPPMSAIDDFANDPSIKIEGPDFFGFEDERTAFDQSPLEDSATGIGRANSEAILSPISQEVNRGDHNELAHMESEEMIDDPLEFSNRQRSQTFSHTSQTSSTQSLPVSGRHNTPALPVRSLTGIEADNRPTAIDPRQMMKRHKSVPDIHYPEHVRLNSMQPPPLPRSADTSPISHPTSPADGDDLIIALHKLTHLLQQNPEVAEPDDYLGIGKLIEKVKVMRAASTPRLPGGMHHIEIMDSPRISKKRTILGIST